MANTRIGLYKESSLHNDIKNKYAIPGDHFEVNVNGYIVDGDLLIEIQTSNFQSIKKKLSNLLSCYQVRIVYPIAVNKWIVRYKPEQFEWITRRKSPKHRSVEYLFKELVFLASLPLNPNFSLEILFIEQEDRWLDDGKGSWRRKYWSISDRHLLNISGRRLFERPCDYLDLIQNSHENPFTSQDISDLSGIPRTLANKMLYCLSRMDLVNKVGKKGRSTLYTVIDL
jgi:hypothetical protein